MPHVPPCYSVDSMCTSVGNGTRCVGVWAARAGERPFTIGGDAGTRTTMAPRSFTTRRMYAGRGLRSDRGWLTRIHPQMAPGVTTFRECLGQPLNEDESCSNAAVTIEPCVDILSCVCFHTHYFNVDLGNICNPVPPKPCPCCS